METAKIKTGRCQNFRQLSLLAIFTLLSDRISQILSYLPYGYDVIYGRSPTMADTLYVLFGYTICPESYSTKKQDYIFNCFLLKL